MQYRLGKEHMNADCFSRLPLPDTEAADPEDRVLMIEQLENCSVLSAQKIGEWTRCDPVLAHVHEYLLHGWPSNAKDTNYAAYWVRKDELSVQDGCVLWGARVVIPPQGPKQVLSELHAAHPGINRMKGLARSYVWWPGMDKDLEHLVYMCSTCQEHQNTPEEFADFMRANGVIHVKTAPYYPSSNGLAERAVQTVKEGIAKTPGDSVHTRLHRFLLQYRITPQSTTGKSPAELLNQRRLKTKLDLLHPNLQGKVQKQQSQIKRNHYKLAAERRFVVGDTVNTKNFGHGPKWIIGVVVKVTGPVSCEVQLSDHVWSDVMLTMSSNPIVDYQSQRQIYCHSWHLPIKNYVFLQCQLPSLQLMLRGSEILLEMTRMSSSRLKSKGHKFHHLLWKVHNLWKGGSHSEKEGLQSTCRTMTLK